MSSPLSSPDASPDSAADSTRGDYESIESPVFNSSNRATSSCDSDRTLTNTDPASDSSPAQSSDAKAINAAASQDNAKITSGYQKGATDEKNTIEKTTIDKTTIEKTTVEKTTVEKTTVEKTTVEKTTVEKTSAEKTSAEKTSAEKTTNEKVPSETTAAQEAIAVQSLNETKKRNYSVTFKPEQYNAHQLKTYHIWEEDEEGIWRSTGVKRKARVPVGDAQHVWLQTQPKEVRDKASEEDRDGTSGSFGTYEEKERKTLHGGVEVEDRTPIQYMSQFIEDHHTPIPEGERKRRRLPKTYTFKTYFPTSALVQCAPSFIYDSSQLNVEYIETVLETKSEESFELKARIQEAIKARKMRRAEAAEGVRLAKAARGFTVAPKKDLRVGLQCHMLSDDGFLLE